MHEHKHGPWINNSMHRGHSTEQRREEQGRGDAETHCHWHLLQVLGVAAMAGSVAGVSLVAMARSELTRRRESRVSRWESFSVRSSMPFSACGRSDGARTRDASSGIAAAYLVAHGCGERERGAERNTDAGLARRLSGASSPPGCMATARLTARRHEKAPR